MNKKLISELKVGEFFMISNSRIVYIRGKYEKSLKRYSATKYFDCNAERFFKGDKEVFVDFTF